MADFRRPKRPTTASSTVIAVTGSWLVLALVLGAQTTPPPGPPVKAGSQAARSPSPPTTAAPRGEAQGPPGRGGGGGARCSISTASPAITIERKRRTCRSRKLDLATVGDHPELWEKVVRKASRRRDASAGREAAAAGRVRGAPGLAGSGNRSQSGRSRQSGLRRPPSSEPDRIRECRPRPAGSRDRCRDAAAAGRFGQRLRQHRGLVDDLSDAAGSLYDGGGEGRPHGGGLLEDADRIHLSRAGRYVAESAHRGAAVRHPRRHAGAPQLPGRWRVQVLDPELRDRQLYSRRAARAHHRRRASASLQIPGRGVEPGHVRRGRWIAGRDHPGESGLADGGRHVPGDELPAQPRHGQAIRPEVAREQQHPSAAVLPRDRFPADSRTLHGAASDRLPQHPQGLYVPPGQRQSGGTLRGSHPRRWRGAPIGVLPRRGTERR